MKLPKKQLGYSQKILMLCVLAAFGSAHADEDEVAQLIKPDSSMRIGLGSATGDKYDRAILGQYNGLRKNDTSLQLDVDVAKRDDATGLWTNFQGSNLGLDNRELNFSQQKQGDWKYVVTYSELVRHDPRTINTGLQNGGTTAPTVVSLATPWTGANLNLNIKRQGLGLGGEKWLTPDLMFELSAKNESRKGSRLSGIGASCSDIVGTTFPCAGTAGAILMLPEPINSTTRQFEAEAELFGRQIHGERRLLWLRFRGQRQWIAESCGGEWEFAES